MDIIKFYLGLTGALQLVITGALMQVTFMSDSSPTATFLINGAAFLFFLGLYLGKKY